MDLVGSIITWVIGLPVALILGCFLGVGAFLLLRKDPGNQVIRSRTVVGLAVVTFVGFVGVILTLGVKWLLLVVAFVLPQIFGYIMGVCTTEIE